MLLANFVMKLLSTFDFQGLVTGVLLCSVGILFLKGAGLVTGQTAGLALLLSYIVPLGFGPLFFILGIPFLVLALRHRGHVFAFRTVLAVLGISAGAQILPLLVNFDHLNMATAAILGGACSGVGLVAIFRHNASAGGMTILSILIEHRTGLKAGWFQLGVDAAVFTASAFVLAFDQLIYSAIGAMVTNLIIVWNFDVAQSGTGRPGYGRPANDGAFDKVSRPQSTSSQSSS